MMQKREEETAGIKSFGGREQTVLEGWGSGTCLIGAGGQKDIVRIDVEWKDAAVPS